MAPTIRNQVQQQIAEAQDIVRGLRSGPRDTTNLIFSRTVLYLLSSDSLSTEQIHPLVQQIHPDICDDSIDRIIGGVRFGICWKHIVRNGHQSLRRRGAISYGGGIWRLNS